MEVREKYTQNIFLVLLAKLIFEMLHTKKILTKIENETHNKTNNFQFEAAYNFLLNSTLKYWNDKFRFKKYFEKR
jgi:hypothetical protein